MNMYQQIYRPLINMDIFIIKYRINHYCTGNCKFSMQPIQNLNSTPYSDIPLISYEDNRIKNVEELLSTNGFEKNILKHF